MKIIYDDLGEGMTPLQRKAMVMHTIIAIFCIPFYSVMPALFGLVVSPYIMWMILSPKQEYLLALVIHFLYGSQQRYLALLAAFVYCIFHIDMLLRRRVLFVFLLYLCSFPFFIWYTVLRYKAFGGGIGMGGTFEGLGYYFGMSYFFWAVAAFGRMKRDVVLGVVTTSGIFVIIFFFGQCGLNFTRFVFWAYPLMPPFCLWMFMKKGTSKRHKRVFALVFICSFMLLLGLLSIGGYSVTFTLMGSSAFACLLIFVARKLPKLIWLVTPLVLLPLLTLRMFSTMRYWEDNVRGNGDNIVYEDIKIRDWESLKYKLYRKTMTDRAPIWTAAWDAVKQQFEKDPVFVDVYAIYGDVDLGDRKNTIAISAHNMFLEMLRLYGLWGGLGIYVVYLILGSLPFTVKAHTILKDTPLAPILACCIAHIVVGGQTGQYPITTNFTFYLFGLLGCCYASAWSIKHSQNNKGLSYDYYMVDRF